MKTFVVIGNPNTGKSTLFNRLTGLNQKIANYPGVTVERKEGRCIVGQEAFQIVDLPGTYSLTPHSPDEEIVTKLLTTSDTTLPSFDGIIIITDATNLERNLFLTTQIIDLGFPTLLAVNMMDEATKKGITLDLTLLEKRLGVSVIATVANRGTGISELKSKLQHLSPPRHDIFSHLKIPPPFLSHVKNIEQVIAPFTLEKGRGALALCMLSRDDELHDFPREARRPLMDARTQAQRAMEAQGDDWRGIETELRYQWIENVCKEVVHVKEKMGRARFNRLDLMVTHRIFGPVFFFGLVAVIFQALFSWSARPMEMIDAFFSFTSSRMAHLLPQGLIQSLLVDGVLAGIGAVVVFVPQIAFLFFSIALLEDSGYMARAAFVMDRLMAKFGLHGKASIPLISSFACAIPGIMATRTIESPRDRFTTIMIAPLMSCSARLPVYTLLISACIPSLTFFGFFNLQGILLWGLYAFGVAVAIVIAFFFKRTVLKSTPLPFLLEMPPYRIPHIGSVFKKTWERCRLFLTNAGTIIFVLSLVLWFLTSFPQSRTPTTEIENTFAGRAGKWIEPAIEPLGFDWKIGVGLIASFAAREVFVSTMSIIYHVDDTNERSTSLVDAIKNDRRPDGTPLFTPLVALSLLVFYALACQCMSTVAVVKRETNSWRWPLFMIAYMTILAYGASFLVYQGGRLLGV